MTARQHDRILAAARTLVAETGYAATTMEAIAAAAGVGKPTLYRWWPNRAALVHEAVLDGVSTRAVPDTGSLAGDLREIVDQVVEFFDQPLVREAWLGSITELRDDREALAAAYRAFLRPAVDAITARLRTAAERGDCRADVEPSVVLDVLLGAGIAGLVVPGDRPPTRRRADALVELLLDGLRPAN